MLQLKVPLVMVRLEPMAWHATLPAARVKIVPRPAEVERALRELLASYPALGRTWRSGTFAEVDAVASFYEVMRRMFGS